jgi:serine/threonine protein kinase
MGQVYLAIDTRLGRHAALKFLSPSLSSGPEMLQRLQQEARAASSLNHPNILTIYDIGDAGGEHFIASEFVEGSTLRTALERQLIDLPAAIEIATQVASALAAAHAAGVIHRDLKPSNIMIRPDGLVKVIDFGLAKIASENPTEPSLHGASRSGAIAGTVEYMSPEQARGDDIDARSDIWSLGVVLYEMVSRKLPFDGETESHVIVGILDHPVPPLPQSGSLPRGIVGVLDRALAKDRNRRYQSARDMLLELKSIAPALDRATALKRFASLPDGPAARAIPRIAALVTLLALVAIWWWPFHGEEALLGPRWFIPGPAEQITFDGKIGVGAMSPDGTYLAFTSRGGERETLHIRNLLTQSELQLPPFEDSALGLTFSPDSRSLYYVLKDRREWGRLFSAGVTSSIPRPVLDDIDGPISFSPDGSEFAFMRRSDDKRTSTESIIVAQTADTGDQRVLVRKSNTQIGRSIAWSPAGNRIAVVLYNLGLNRSVHPTLVLFSPDGKPRESFSNPKLRTINGPVWLANGSVIAFAEPFVRQHERRQERQAFTSREIGAYLGALGCRCH